MNGELDGELGQLEAIVNGQTWNHTNPKIGEQYD